MLRPEDLTAETEEKAAAYDILMGGGGIMLYRTLKRMIERGQTEGMEEKIDLFFAAGKLTEAEYTELMDMLHPKTEADANE